MAKSMLVNVVNEEESRIAIVSNGLLEELSIESSQHEQIEGNIYKGKIVKIIPSLDAVFVDYGGNRNGFLAAPDIHAKHFGDGPRSVDRLRKGQQLMVQVRKGEIGQKGAALTTYVSIPGRYFVLMPHTTKRGVSRKIDDESTRKQLRKILDDAGVPEEMGYIARTAANGRTKQDLQRDAGYLLRLWKRIQAEYDNAKTPSLLYQDSHIAIRTIRDYFNPSIQEVWVDDKEIYDQVRSFFQAVMPWNQRRVKLYQQKAPIFSKYNLESQIASIYEKKVPLASGGSIVIEQTEALVSVDVNSGKTTKGKDIEETAFITNQEAAEEAARQLRLRDMGGLVVIDFIDMRSAKRRNEVRKTLQKALKEDKARTDTGTISKFGLLELSRQRIKSAGSVGTTTTCPVCSGLGKVRSTESFALSVLRMIQSELARKQKTEQVLVGVPMDVATLLLNRKRQKITELEAAFQTGIGIFGEPALRPNQYYVEYREDGTRRVDTNVPEDVPRSLLRTTQGLPGPAPRTRQLSYALFEDEGETPEVPEVPEEPPDEEEAEKKAAGQGDEGGKPKKRRRRRSKRKKTTEGAEEAAADAAASEPDRGEAAKETPPPKKAAPQEVPDRGETASDDDAGSNRKLSASAKRRLRRKRKKMREAAEAQEGAPREEAGQRREPDGVSEVSERPVKVEEPPQKGKAPEAPQEAPAEKPPEPPPAQAAEETPAAAAEAAPEEPSEESAEAAPAKPKRRRPARKKAPAKQEAAAPEEARAKPVPAPAEADAAAEAKTPKPRRRTRKPAAKKEPAPEEAAEKPAEEAAEAAPAKTARRRSPRKKAPQTEVEVGESAAAPDAGPPPEESPEPAKKPRRRTTRTTKKAKAEGDEGSGNEEPGEAKPKAPRKRRAPARKKAKEAEPEGGEGGGEAS